MARVWTIQLTAASFVPESSAQLVAGDLPATLVNHKDRMAWAFDDTAEEAIVSMEMAVPDEYAGGTVTARIYWGTQATTSNVRWDVFVESVTANSDTLDLSDTASWDSANSSSDAAPGTAGDVLYIDVTLTNKDSMAVGDIWRIGLRRDTDHADDAISGDCFIYLVDVFETA